MGGNTDDGRSGGKGNYIIAIAPLPLEKLQTKTTVDSVANPFGREAMKQGAKSSVEIAKGQSLQLRFGALIHDGQLIDFADEYKVFLESQ